MKYSSVCLWCSYGIRHPSKVDHDPSLDACWRTCPSVMRRRRRQTTTAVLRLLQNVPRCEAGKTEGLLRRVQTWNFCSQQGEIFSVIVSFMLNLLV